MFRAPFGDSLARNANAALKAKEKNSFLPKTFFGNLREKY